MQTLAKDISRWQGTYSETNEPIIFVKISGGDMGLYIDPQAQSNYDAVIAHGHAFGGYHFFGNEDPVQQANYFLEAMKPWNPGEVPAVDIESGANWNPNAPGYNPVPAVLAFVNQVHSVAGAWPMVYMNLSTLLAHDWSPVTNNCGIWLADWTGHPDEVINSGKYTYAMQQYSDGPSYDHDVFFGTVDQFKKYGWPAAAPAPALSPAPSPAPAPEPTPPVAPPAPDPTPPSVPAEPAPPAPQPPVSTTTIDNPPVPTPPGPVQPLPAPLPKPVVVHSSPNVGVWAMIGAGIAGLVSLILWLIG